MNEGHYAATYDRLNSSPELAPLRARVAGRAHGDVLEIGAGTGANLPFYPADAHLSAVEPNPHMAVRLQAKAAARGRAVAVAIRRGEDLPYPDRSFDVVISTLVLCSVADQSLVLREIRRVLRPGGRFLFLEHVASDDERVRRWPRRLNPLSRLLNDGCTLDRDTAAAIRAAGFTSVDIEDTQLAAAAAISRRLIAGQARA